MATPDPDHSTLTTLLRAGLAAGLRPRLTIVSGSMTPLLRPGDQVEVERIDPGNLAPGDIVVLVTSHELITHRLLAAGDGSILTQGDRLPSPDPRYPSAAVLGRVISRWRAGHRLDLTGYPGRNRSLFLGRLVARRERIARRLPSPFRRPVRAAFKLLAAVWAHLYL